MVGRPLRDHCRALRRGWARHASPLQNGATRCRPGSIAGHRRPRCPPVPPV